MNSAPSIRPGQSCCPVFMDLHTVQVSRRNSTKKTRGREHPPKSFTHSGYDKANPIYPQRSLCEAALVSGSCSCLSRRFDFRRLKAIALWCLHVASFTTPLEARACPRQRGRSHLTELFARPELQLGARLRPQFRAMKMQINGINSVCRLSAGLGGKTTENAHPPVGDRGPSTKTVFPPESHLACCPLGGRCFPLVSTNESVWPCPRVRDKTRLPSARIVAPLNARSYIASNPAKFTLKRFRPAQCILSEAFLFFTVTLPLSTGTDAQFSDVTWTSCNICTWNSVRHGEVINNESNSGNFYPSSVGRRLSGLERKVR